MCGGMLYKVKSAQSNELETRKVYFPMPNAQIPVLADNTVRLVQWGRREGEDPGSIAPQTGWARMNNIDGDYWQHFKPVKRLIPALKFAEKGKLKQSKWFDLPEAFYLLGLQVTIDEKSFVYVVTNPAIGKLADIHPRMPLLVNEDMQPVDFKVEPPEQQLGLFS